MISERKDTIVILIPGFPGSETDTTCLPMQQRFVKTLSCLNPGPEIIIISFHYPFRNGTYSWNSTKVISLDGRNKTGLYKYWLRRKAFLTLMQLNREYKIIGLLSFWYGECALVGKRFAGMHGLKHFCWLMGQDAKANNKYPRKVKLRSGELIALSGFLENEFEKNHGIRPKHVIPPGMDPMPDNQVAKEKKIDILAVGSLIKLKQFDIFLEIIASLKKRHPGIHAILIGDGPEKENLLQQLSALKLENNCRLTGELPYSDVQQMMRESGILIHPSSYEGFSGVCQEALYHGAQVISFCRAMNQEIPGWHIVQTKEEMAEKAQAILEGKIPYYMPADQYTIVDTASSIVKLFV